MILIERHAVIALGWGRHLLRSGQRGHRQQALAHGRAEARAQDVMNVALCPRRDFAFKCYVQLIDLGRLHLLQEPRAQGRHHMPAQQLSVAIQCPAPNWPAVSARSADREPMFDPLTKGGLVGRDVLAVIAALEQAPQLLACVR